MTQTVKILKSYFEDATDLLDDYCHQVCAGSKEQDCLKCPVRIASLDCRAGRLACNQEESTNYHTKCVRGDDVPLRCRGGEDDIKSNRC